MSKVTQILTEEDYDRALTRMNDIFQAEIGTPDGDERDALFDLIEEYENEHYPIEPPSIIGAIEFYMDQQGLTEDDLIPLIGSRQKVVEVLSGKREITASMARALHKHWGISVEIDVQPNENEHSTSKGHPILEIVERAKANMPKHLQPEDVPTDAAKNYRHYMYGWPKESDR